ncbi:unnamed protein product [Chrysoparadoxa australica]
MYSPMRRRLRVVCAMSGGVDSSIAALLLKKQNYEVVGLHMHNWDRNDEAGEDTCPHERDLEDASAVCRQLGIELHTVNFVREYWTQVFEPALATYAAGATPNPDVMCNRHIKFSAFRRHCFEVLGADAMATGHYCRLKQAGGAGVSDQVNLLKGLDPSKDQSYFLASVSHEQLRDVIFPVGGMLKQDVRELAQEAGLVTAMKGDSTGLCFVGKRKSFSNFLQQYVVPSPGEFIDVDTGAVVGQHDGYELYTIGQGARIGGQPCRWFVAGKSLADKAIYIVPHADHPALQHEYLTVNRGSFNWVSGHEPIDMLTAEGRQVKLTCQTRYRSKVNGCVVHPEGDKLRVVFDTPEPAVAPAQVAVLYDGDVVLGGGAISNTKQWPWP